jgi:G3E family GTPase
VSRRDRLTLTVVTGFLGSGKTTLLRRLLGDGRSDVAVVVNEFADTGVDHDLIAPLCARAIAVTGGCACCERRQELLAALREILDDYERGRLDSVRHVVIETSGLADPLPIVTAVITDPVLRHHFELGAVIAVVDGLEGSAQLNRNPVMRRQVAGADDVVISKTDLADRAQIDALQASLGRLGEPGEDHRHSENVRTVALEFREPLDWVAFGVWLSLLVHAHGPRLLRIKGILPAAGLGAIAINAVQHALYPPEHVDAPSVPARLVVIAQGLAVDSINRSLLAFQRAA